VTLSDTALPLDRILELVDAVPRIERFPSVDELVAVFDRLAAHGSVSRSTP
jgi:hypothetical protein